LFKGTGRALKVVLDERADLSDALVQIEARLASNPGFYAGQRITVESKSGLLPDDLSVSIREVFKRYGLTCSVADRKSASEMAAAMITQTVLGDEVIPTNHKTMDDDVRDEFCGEAAIHRGDVVPGKSVSFEGSVVVLGDVLFGGKVTASGDIIVTGAAGGHLHAGWPSDKTARIYAAAFAGGSYKIGEAELEIWEAVGGSMKLCTIRWSIGGLTLESGDAGKISRKGE
jgi:septum site-determining protein MinC